MKATLFGSGLVVAAAWSYLRHIQLPVGPSRMEWGAQVFGHRGCRFVSGIPENTIPAFQYAITKGATGIELDVRLSKDNELVVFHDAFCNGHVTGAPKEKRIDEMELFDIKQLQFVEDPTGEIRIPTLEESILFCREHRIKMLIEIKELAKPRVCVDKVAELYRRYPEYMYKETTVIAFSPKVLYALRSLDAKIAVGQLYSGDVIHSWVTSGTERCPLLFTLFPALFDRITLFLQSKVNPWVSGVSFVCPKYTLFTPEVKRMWHSRRIAVYLWGFPDPQSCTIDMRTKGVLVACDDRHDEFATPKPPPDFDIFGDRAREEERQREEAAQRQRLTK